MKPIDLLKKEYLRLAGDVVGVYLLRIHGNDEQKKAAETMDFLNNILTGKGIAKKEWRLFEDENFILMQEYATLINSLQK